MSQTATLYLRDHEVQARIGIHAHERERPQRLIINAGFDVEIGPDHRDEIAATLDYDFLRDGIAALLTARHFDLQETLCLAILNLIQAQQGVQAATVSTEKPDIYPDCAGVGCRVSWRRDPGTLR